MPAATVAAPGAAPAKQAVHQPKQLPPPNSDFYELYETLNADELATVKRVRAFMEAKVAPVITKYWVDDAFPFELLPAVKELGIGGVGMKGYGCAGGSLALLGFVQMEIARIDPSFSTFMGVHNGLAMGSIYIERIGRTEAEMAAADGAFREDRLFRPDRAAGGVRRERRPAHHGEARGRHLDPQWREAVDRQRSVVRHLDYLGARSGR
jgi:alkylation response protein AidB-like acyl-CoA dehydrogenase